MGVTGTVERVNCEKEAVFDWKLKDFFKILGRGDYSCESPSFHLCGHTWILKLYTRDVWDSIQLFVLSNNPHPSAGTRYSLGIRSTSGKTEMEVAGTLYFYGEEPKRSGLETTIKKSELFRRREEVLPLEVLTVTATIKRKSAAEGTRDVCVQTEVEGIATEAGKDERSEKKVPDTKDVSVQTRVEDRASEDGKDEQSERTGTERVLQDIGKMWPSDEHCDVVFRVGDVEFKAHREILSARTPVLCAMFRHDTAEKASGVVTIEDCEPAVFEQLLHYVYKGAPLEVTAENAYPLFTLADKHLVSEVKALCVRCIRDTLCVDSFCNAVTLALMHREDELLETAVDLFSRNMLGILQTVQWHTFFLEHSTWANEIMIRAVKIREEKRPDGDWSRA